MCFVAEKYNLFMNDHGYLKCRINVHNNFIACSANYYSLVTITELQLLPSSTPGSFLRSHQKVQDCHVKVV